MRIIQHENRSLFVATTGRTNQTTQTLINDVILLNQLNFAVTNMSMRERTNQPYCVDRIVLLCETVQQNGLAKKVKPKIKDESNNESQNRKYVL